MLNFLARRALGRLFSLRTFDDLVIGRAESDQQNLPGPRLRRLTLLFVFLFKRQEELLLAMIAAALRVRGARNVPRVFGELNALALI